jgi:hypothetical protein
VRRTFANYRGTRFSLSRTYAFAGIYITLAIIFSALSFLGGVSILVVVPEILLAAIAA